MPDAPSPEAGITDAVAEAFWAFSLDLYAHPAIAAACLRLQDELGLDVNLVLLCCWLARSGRGPLSENDLAAAEARVASWRREILEPLRAARRAVKRLAGKASPLYAEMKRLELHAEREEQRRLLAGSLGGGRAAHRVENVLATNLGLYLTRHGHSADSAADLIRAVESIG